MLRLALCATKVSEKCRSEDRGRRQARRKEGGPRDRLGLIASVVVSGGSLAALALARPPRPGPF